MEIYKSGAAIADRYEIEKIARCGLFVVDGSSHGLALLHDRALAGTSATKAMLRSLTSSIMPVLEVGAGTV
jgi:hypothetical protein